MKAVIATAVGGPEVLEYTDVPEPVAGPGQVLVKVDAAGVNFIDTYRRSGIYKMNFRMSAPRVPVTSWRWAKM